MHKAETDVTTFQALNEGDRFIVVTPSSSDFRNGSTAYILEKFACKGEEVHAFGHPYFAIRENNGTALAIAPTSEVIRVVGQ